MEKKSNLINNTLQEELLPTNQQQNIDYSEKVNINEYSNFNSNITLNFSDSLVIIFLALIAGLLVRFLYQRFGNSFSSKASYSNTLLMVTVCVACLIAVVKSSLALSLGLVGALSVVRFRTAVKEPYTLSFILFSVCLGIAIGASQYIFALMTALVGIFVSMFVNRISTEKVGSGKSNQTDIDTLNVTASNEKCLFEAMSIASSFFNTYSIKTISASNNIECLATIGINLKSNKDLNELIKILSKSPGIINVTFYNNPI